MIFVLDRSCYYSLWYGEFCSPSHVCHRSGKIQVQNALFNVGEFHVGEFHVDSGKNKASQFSQYDLIPLILASS